MAETLLNILCAYTLITPPNKLSFHILQMWKLRYTEVYISESSKSKAKGLVLLKLSHTALWKEQPSSRPGSVVSIAV